MGPQNATALSPLQTRFPQPSEHETHLMWPMQWSGRTHFVRLRRVRMFAQKLAQTRQQNRRADALPDLRVGPTVSRLAAEREPIYECADGGGRRFSLG